MPNRMLRDSICCSETLARLTGDAERFFYRLMTQADDYGRFDARLSVLRSRCFQLGGVTDEDVEQWLKATEIVGLICRYQVGERTYGYFPTWQKYQRIRSPQSRYPDPPQQDATSCGDPQLAAAPTRARASGVVVEDVVVDGVVVRKSRRIAASTLPKDFPFTEARRKFAEAGGVADPALEFAQFKDHHRAKGSLMYDWEAAWKTWCRNAVKYAARQQMQPQRR